LLIFFFFYKLPNRILFNHFIFPNTSAFFFFFLSSFNLVFRHTIPATLFLYKMEYGMKYQTNLPYWRPPTSLYLEMFRPNEENDVPTSPPSSPSPSDHSSEEFSRSSSPISELFINSPSEEANDSNAATTTITHATRKQNESSRGRWASRSSAGSIIDSISKPVRKIAKSKNSHRRCSNACNEHKRKHQRCPPECMGRLRDQMLEKEGKQKRSESPESDIQDL
jgi:hypothetical protein